MVSVYPFATNQQAIELANATEYGLNASIWSRDTELARRMATRIHAGTVNVNEAYAAAWGSVEAPMGGFKSSGLGRRHGSEGILKYTEAQTVAVQRGMPIAAPTGVPDEVFGRWMTQAPARAPAACPACADTLSEVDDHDPSSADRFPGFLGSELVRRILARKAKPSVVCLVQPKFVTLAKKRLAEIEDELAPAGKGAKAGLGGRLQLVTGDITQKDLGLENPATLAREVSEIFHLAAVYDLSVKRESRDEDQRPRHPQRPRLRRQGCPKLRRLQYVSTCYVSGRYAGIFREDDLDARPGVQQLLRGDQVPRRSRGPRDA